ncbi:MAG: hypothetical protein HY273_01090 [Gammaproteobacteria bacterium]|nr:hypothetical protein [Gammaproteobacteria bacterium]
MMNGKMLVTLCVAMESLGGCATTTHFTSIPTSNEDFSQPIAMIREKYGDVALYEPKELSWPDIFNSSSRPPGPSINELEGKWGVPTKTKSNWGEWTIGTILTWSLGAITGQWWVAGTTTMIFIPPVKTYYWDKGTTHIEARVSNFMFHGYEGRLGIWQWSEATHKKGTQTSVLEPDKLTEQ